MTQPKITFVINGNTYNLSANDTGSIGRIPKDDRQELITLLEAVKRQEQLSEAAVQRAVNNIKISPQAKAKSFVAQSMPGQASPKPERLGKGDVENLMARLIVEEKQNQKPPLTRQTLYKWMAGILVAVVLLVLIF